MALLLEVEAGETVIIGGSRISVQRKSGAKVRLRIESPDEVHLDRGMGEEGKPDTAPAPSPPEPQKETLEPRPLLSRPPLR